MSAQIQFTFSKPYQCEFSADFLSGYKNPMQERLEKQFQSQSLIGHNLTNLVEGLCTYIKFCTLLNPYNILASHWIIPPFRLFPPFHHSSINWDTQKFGVVVASWSYRKHVATCLATKIGLTASWHWWSKMVCVWRGGGAPHICEHTNQTQSFSN